MPAVTWHCWGVPWLHAAPGTPLGSVHLILLVCSMHLPLCSIQLGPFSCRTPETASMKHQQLEVVPENPWHTEISVSLGPWLSFRIISSFSLPSCFQRKKGHFSVYIHFFPNIFKSFLWPSTMPVPPADRKLPCRVTVLRVQVGVGRRDGTTGSTWRLQHMIESIPEQTGPGEYSSIHIALKHQLRQWLWANDFDSRA